MQIHDLGSHRGHEPSRRDANPEGWAHICSALSALGAMGVVRPSPTAVQVVLGPVADQVAADIRAHLGGTARAATVPATSVAQASAPPPSLPTEPLLALLGGPSNIVSVTAAAGRLLVTVAHPDALRRDGLEDAGVTDLGVTSSGTVHLLVGDSAQATAAELRKSLQ